MTTSDSALRKTARHAGTGLAIAATLFILTADAFARPSSGGSRGSRSSSPPPVTNTAPRQAQPLPGQGINTPAAAPRPGTATPAPQGNRFGGFLGGLGAGLLGAGLMGMLFGGGFMSGIGSFMGILGMILQFALLAGLVMFAVSWFRRRNQPAAATAGFDAMARQPAQPDWRPAASPMGGAAPAMAQPAPVETQPIEIVADDFNRFEAMLGEVQTAFGAGDRVKLARLATPEMANILNQDLDDLARRGLVNRLSGVKLLQGDLSEAWREPGAEYATVAMRYSIVDAKVEKLSGKTVEGDLVRPQEVTEVWTFMREPGANVSGWQLSAIQQA